MQISFNCQRHSCSESTKFNSINQACIRKGDADSSKMRIGASDIFILPYRIQGSYSINCYHLLRPYLLFLAPPHPPPIYREGNRFYGVCDTHTTTTSHLLLHYFSLPYFLLRSPGFSQDACSPTVPFSFLLLFSRHLCHSSFF